MFLQALILIVGYYLFTGASYYVYGVMKSHELLGFWDFSIKNGYIGGICPYPRWVLFYVEWIINAIWRFR